MPLLSILIIVGLIVVGVVATKWYRYAFGVIAALLAIFGIVALVRQTEWRTFLQGTDLRGLAPQVVTMGIAALVIAALLTAGAVLAKRGKAFVGISLALIYLVLGTLIYYEYIGTFGFLRAMWRAGAVQAMITPQEMRTYQGTSKENLKALYTAMMLEHDSEGAFPKAAEWMDALKDRLATNDMSLTEAEKKYVNPMAGPAKPGQFGYAMNAALEGKYKDDVKDPDKTLLIFDSSDTSRNAHGDPTELLPKSARQGGNLGVTVSGKVVEIAADGTLKPVD
jgi:hypothetical protein